MLTDKEYAWLERIEKAIDKEWDNLKPFEQKFTEDLLERFKLYGKKLTLSPKQWEIITEISDKII